MQKCIIRKGLVIGVIAIFILVGVQPAFAVEISNDTTSETIEDCNCKPISNLHRVRIESLLNKANRLLNRVNIFTNLIPILYKDNPKVLEDYRVLTEKINTYREMNEELNTVISPEDYPPIICALLNVTLDIMDILIDIIDIFIEKFGKYEILRPFLFVVYASALGIWLAIDLTEAALGCPYWWLP